MRRKIEYKGTCYIVGAAPVSSYEMNYIKKTYAEKEAKDLWIAADGGAVTMALAGAVPDLILGDFDSYQEMVAAGEQTDALQQVALWLEEKDRLVFPKEKDQTDLYLAYLEGKKAEYYHFVFIGAYLGRPDHTMANYQMLSEMAEKGDSGLLIADHWHMLALKNGLLRIPDLKKGAYVSVFSLSNKSSGVDLLGLYYSMTGGTLSRSFALGVSNEALGGDAIISVERGTLLIMWETEEY